MSKYESEDSFDDMFDQDIYAGPAIEAPERKVGPHRTRKERASSGERVAKFRKITKYTGRTILAGLVLMGAMEVKKFYDDWRNFGLDLGGADSAEVQVSAPQTMVIRDQYVALEKVVSEFEVDMKLHQDRPLIMPDCNLNFDEEVTAENHATLSVGQAEITTDDTSVTINVTGELGMTPTHTDWQEDEELNISGLSYCNGTENVNRIRQAFKGIVDGAGEVATACAFSSDEGLTRLSNSVESFFVDSGLAGDVTDKEVTTNIPDLELGIADMYEQAANNFNDVLAFIEEDTVESGQDSFVSNGTEILDCRNHEVSFEEVEEAN